MAQEQADQQWLEGFIGRERGLAGTVHRVRGEVLHLTAALNIPPPAQTAVATVPRGKGGGPRARARPAGADLQPQGRRQRPGAALARTVDGRAAIALPVMAADGAVRAVVGIAFGFEFEGEIAPEAERALAAATLP